MSKINFTPVDYENSYSKPVDAEIVINEHGKIELNITNAPMHLNGSRAMADWLAANHPHLYDKVTKQLIALSKLND